jgi:hypothetical protein
MAGTVTFSDVTQLVDLKGGGSLKKITITWESDASGDATGTSPYKVHGVLLRAVFNPSADAPTDNYDVVLNDENGMDVLGGQGANLDTANSNHVCPGMPLTDGTTTSVVPIALADALSLVVSNAGNANDGVIVLYLG